MHPTIRRLPVAMSSTREAAEILGGYTPFPAYLTAIMTQHSELKSNILRPTT